MRHCRDYAVGIVCVAISVDLGERANRRIWSVGADLKSARKVFGDLQPDYLVPTPLRL